MCFSIKKISLLCKNLLKHSNKSDAAIALCLSVVSLLTRIPFASRMIFEGDSARFALALKQYDVAQMRPHAPGYILYVALAKLVDLVVHDPSTSFVSISIVASALTVFCLYHFANKMYGRPNALICSLLLITSPVFWYNGEIPLTYALEGLISVFFALSCYKVITGEKKWLVVSAIVLAIATGVRQNTILFFLPLWLFSMRKCSLKQILISFSIFGVVCLAWFIPMVVLTGGFERYFLAIEGQFNTWVLHPAPFLFEIIGRWKVFSTFVIYGFGLALVPMIYYFGRFFKLPAIVEDLRLQFILFWILPSVCFFIGVNVFNSGHIVVILPPLCICVAESVKGLASDINEGIHRIFPPSNMGLNREKRKVFSYNAITGLVVIPILLVNIYMFFFTSTPVSYKNIRDGDRTLAELVRLTKENFVPEKTLIITFAYNTQASLYLPDYRIYCPFPLMFSSAEVPIEAQNVYISFHHQTSPKTYWLSTDFKIKPIPVPKGIDTVVIWEEEISEYYHNREEQLVEVNSEISKTKIYFAKIEPEEMIHYDYHYLSIE